MSLASRVPKEISVALSILILPVITRISAEPEIVWPRKGTSIKKRIKPSISVGI